MRSSGCGWKGGLLCWDREKEVVESYKRVALYALFGSLYFWWKGNSRYKSPMEDKIEYQPVGSGSEGSDFAEQ